MCQHIHNPSCPTKPNRRNCITETLYRLLFSMTQTYRISWHISNFSECGWLLHFCIWDLAQCKCEVLNQSGPNKLSKHFGFIGQYISETLREAVFKRAAKGRRKKKQLLHQSADPSGPEHWIVIHVRCFSMILNRISLHQCYILYLYSTNIVYINIYLYIIWPHILLHAQWLLGIHSILCFIPQSTKGFTFEIANLKLKLLHVIEHHDDLL